MLKESGALMKPASTQADQLLNGTSSSQSLGMPKIKRKSTESPFYQWLSKVTKPSEEGPTASNTDDRSGMGMNEVVIEDQDPIRMRDHGSMIRVIITNDLDSVLEQLLAQQEEMSIPESMDIEMIDNERLDQREMKKIDAHELHDQDQLLQVHTVNHEQVMVVIPDKWVRNEETLSSLMRHMGMINPRPSTEYINKEDGKDPSRARPIDFGVAQTPNKEGLVLKGLVAETVLKDKENSKILSTPEIRDSPKLQVQLQQLLNQYHNMVEGNEEVDSTYREGFGYELKPNGTLPIRNPGQSESFVRLTHLADDLKQVLQPRIHLMQQGETVQLRVKVFPENLGHLDIKIASNDGRVTAQILTSNSMAKEVLDVQLHQLRYQLGQQGVQVDRIEVSNQSQSQSMLQDHQHKSGQQFFHQKGQRNPYQDREEKMDEEFFYHQDENEWNSQSTVNYAV